MKRTILKHLEILFYILAMGIGTVFMKHALNMDADAINKALLLYIKAHLLAKP